MKIVYWKGSEHIKFNFFSHYWSLKNYLFIFSLFSWRLLLIF